MRVFGLDLSLFVFPTGARRQRQSFLDVEAEEADEAEEETFEDAVGGGQDDLTLHLLEDDDEAILRAPAMEGEEEEDERMAISSRRSDSRKLSLNSRDLFASKNANSLMMEPCSDLPASTCRKTA